MTAAMLETRIPTSAEISGERRSRADARTRLARIEDLVLSLLLSVMIALPLVEIVLRQFSIGIPSAPDFLRHLTLWVGMAGGAIAAREGRLLALSNAGATFRDNPDPRARLIPTGVATAITVVLCVASVRFVFEEREGGGALAYDFPRWIAQLALPIGFGAIALRMIFSVGRAWPRRLCVVLLAAAFGFVGAFFPVWLSLGGLLVAMVWGAPIFVVLGGATLLLLVHHGDPITTVAIDHYGLVTNPALPALPLFTLAGYFMAEGGASKRLVGVFQALSGWMRGGPAIATALICAFFTAFTGGSGVTILALGGLLLPVLLNANYSEREAVGLLTGAGSLGILLPPCLPVILYAIIAQVDINTMFVAGLVPGMLLILLTAGWGIWIGRRSAPPARALNRSVLFQQLWRAKWEMLMPVVSLAMLFSGWATPVEAASATAAYALFVEVVIHRDLDLWRDCPRVMTEAGLLIGGILLILGVALGLTNFLVDAQVPNALAEWSLEHVRSRWLFLLGLNVSLIVVGSFVEIYAAIVVVVPLLVPIGVRLDLNPIHLGIIFLANMELGFLAPPFGLNLLLASARLRRPIAEVTRATLPLLAVMGIGVVLITYFPALSTWLPGVLCHSTP